MKAMILAAGVGERLGPLTEKLPKALMPVLGRPMIEYPLLLVRHYGIREVLINLRHLGQRIEEYLGKGERLGLKVSYSREEEVLDTGGGLLRAKAFLEGETFVVINCDVLIDLALDELLSYHAEKKAAATLVLRPDRLADQYGPIETAPDGRVRRFLQFELPGRPAAPLTKQMFTGVQVLEPRIFHHMDGALPFSLTRAIYPRMLLQGEPLYGFTCQGYWQDLGTAERIKEAEEKIKRGEVKLSYLR